MSVCKSLSVNVCYSSFLDCWRLIRVSESRLPGSARTLLSLVTLLGLNMAPSYASGFVTARTYPADFSPASIAVGDFNGDGILDLAVVNAGSYGSASGNVSVLLGKGDGSFQPTPAYTVGAYAFSAVVSDFNGDGHLDLAVAGYLDVEPTTPEVSILLGNGDGTFQAVQNYPTQGGSLAVGDLNGDGHLDLVTSGGSVLLGNGDGTFQVIAAPQRSRPAAVALGTSTATAFSTLP